MNKRQLPVVLALVLLLTSCAKLPLTDEPRRMSFFALDTVISLTGCGEDNTHALSEVRDNISAMEKELSRTRPDSLIYRLNHAEGVPQPIDAATQRLLDQGNEMYRLTDGAFDLTIAPAADLWGFTKDEFRVPGAQEIDTVKATVGTEHIHLREGSVWLDEGTALDLGGIAKGLALEEAKDIFSRHGLTGGLVNLGGDILAYGQNGRNAPWRIAVRDPDSGVDASAFLGVLTLSDCYILTSGGYERYFEADGKQYQHIIDPKTCSPAESDLRSVTVVTGLDEGSGVYADALATALFVMGCEDAIRFWQSSDLNFELILADDAGHVYVTEGLQDAFTPDDSSSHHYLELRQRA